MKTEEIFKTELEALRNEVISTIKSHMVRIKGIINDNTEDDEDGDYEEVRLSTQINIEYIDEHTSESICAISFNGDAIIDTGLDNCIRLQLNVIKLEKLIDVVGQLELFETYEDVEFHLM